MKVLLHLKIISKDNFIFENKLSSIAAKFEQKDNIVLLDADNFSDIEYLNHLSSLINDSEKCILLFESFSEEGTIKFRKLIESVFKKKDNVLILILGNNQIIERLLNPLSQNIIKVEHAIPDKSLFEFLA